MISLIVCSRSHGITAELKQNIAETIGAEYELVIIDNSTNQLSIFSAYNEGVRRSKGDYCCFMHDDILYHTKNWGNIVENYFHDFPKAGMIGLVGSHFMPATISTWWDAEVLSGHILQVYPNQRTDNPCLVNYSVYHTIPTKVSVIDGVWMCIPRKLLNVVKWDALSFNGFHGYDIDMSLQIWDLHYEVHIVWDILIEHKSIGATNQSFYQSMGIITEKWKNILPCIKGIEMTNGEIEARTRMVEIKQELRNRHIALKNIYASPFYRLMHKLKLL